MNETPAPATSHANDRSGLPAALGAYLIWGLLPLYLILVKRVPPFEFVAWRIVWTLPLCLGIVSVRRQWPEIRAAIGDRRVIGVLVMSAALIGVNWLVYIWAIQSGEVYAASLGYYINPLVNVLLGTLVLGERLSRRQWLAVGIAAAGIATLLGGAVTTLWISLTLAASFSLYGLLRKRVPVGALPGLTIESAVLLAPAIAVAGWYAAAPGGGSFGHEWPLSLAIMLGGVVTAIPLWMFAVAARRMSYSVLGFVQFLAPTIVFVLGLTVFGKPLHRAELIAFGLIWCAIAVFVWDLWAKARATPAAAS